MKASTAAKIEPTVNNINNGNEVNILLFELVCRKGGF